MSKLEKDIEKAFVKYVERNGAIALKLRIDGKNGWPDRTVITTEGVFFVEFKKPGGKVHPKQAQWIAQLRQAGQTAEVCDSISDALSLFECFMAGVPSEYRFPNGQRRDGIDG